MSDASLVAAELQDLTSTVERVAEAIRDTGKQVVEVKLPPPVLNVNVPSQEQQAPVVNFSPSLPPMQVVVAPSTARVEVPVVLQRAEPVAYEVTITERDESGFISRFVIIPINAG